MRPNLHDRLSIVFVMGDQLPAKSLEATEQGDAEAAQFQVNRILIPCIRFAQEKMQVSVMRTPPRAAQTSNGLLWLHNTKSRETYYGNER